MKKLQSLTLIDGNFSPNEMREILMTLFSNKIQFHQVKNVRSLERFGKEDKTALKRIEQLKKDIEKTLKAIDGVQKKGELVEIKAALQINFIKSKKNV